MSDNPQFADNGLRIFRHLRLLDGPSGPVSDKSGRKGPNLVAATQESIFSNPLSFV
jgi:hypothetical protein